MKWKSRSLYHNGKYRERRPRKVWWTNSWYPYINKYGILWDSQGGCDSPREGIPPHLTSIKGYLDWDPSVKTPTEALRLAIQRELRTLEARPHDHVNFSMTAHGFTQAFQSVNFQVREFLEQSLRLDTLLQSLAERGDGAELKWTSQKWLWNGSVSKITSWVTKYKRTRL